MKVIGQDTDQANALGPTSIEGSFFLYRVGPEIAQKWVCSSYESLSSYIVLRVMVMSKTILITSRLSNSRGTNSEN